MRDHKKGERGQILIMVALALIPICGALGLVIDVGWAYFTKESAQVAAESAALAAVQAAIDQVKNGSASYTCGTGGLPCQTPTACSSSTRGNLLNGCEYAAANGFTNGGQSGQQTITIEANTTTPVPTVPGLYQDVLYWVTVRISQVSPLSFGAMMGASSLLPSVRATAAVVGTPSGNCMVALNSSASGAIELKGHDTVNLGCGVAINSSSSTALRLNGSKESITASNVQVVGQGSLGNGTVNPTPTYNAKPVSDPYANIAPPSYVYSGASSCAPQPPSAWKGSFILNPGVYCGGLTLNSGDYTFNAGTYVLLGGGLTISGNATLTGTGISFYNTCTNGCTPGSTDFAPLQIDGSPTLNLSAPTSGPSAGVLFYEDRGAPQAPDSIKGSAQATLTGGLYFFNNHLQFAGNYSVQTQQIVADSIEFNGTGTLTIAAPSASSGNSGQIKAALVE